jgi:hypothetical protein
VSALRSAATEREQTSEPRHGLQVQYIHRGVILHAVVDACHRCSLSPTQSAALWRCIAPLSCARRPGPVRAHSYSAPKDVEGLRCTPWRACRRDP